MTDFYDGIAVNRLFLTEWKNIGKTSEGRSDQDELYPDDLQPAAKAGLFGDRRGGHAGKLERRKRM